MSIIDQYKLITNSSLADAIDDHPNTHKAGRHTGTRGIHKTRGRPPTLLTDEEVIECRVLFETKMRSKNALCQKYDIDIAYITRLLNYLTRSRVIPTNKDIERVQRKYGNQTK